MPKPTIALVTEGNAESADKSFSGISHSLLTHLRAAGHTVHAIDAELYGIHKAIGAARAYSPDKSVWKTSYRLGSAAFAARSARAAAGLRAVQADVILQTGATFDPPRGSGLPYALYCDWNMALASRFQSSGQGPAQHMSAKVAEGVNAREAAVYRGASAIFTISGRLRSSFVDDYRLDANKIFVGYPGPNFDVSRIPPRPERPADAAPTVLFVGKEFARKGGDDLLAAFAQVRTRVPNARLRVVGPTDIGPVPEGVELLGSLRKEDPAEWARLVEAYASADVFCLPTRYEPLGIVVIEAMYFGIPCVTSDTWAMGEMVADGETGRVVPVNDRGRLADALLGLLTDRDLARRMGAAGRERAGRLFSWAATADIISRQLTEIVERGAGRADGRKTGAGR